MENLHLNIITNNITNTTINIITYFIATMHKYKRVALSSRVYSLHVLDMYGRIINILTIITNQHFPTFSNPN